MDLSTILSSIPKDKLSVLKDLLQNKSSKDLLSGISTGSTDPATDKPIVTLLKTVLKWISSQNVASPDAFPVWMKNWVTYRSPSTDYALLYAEANYLGVTLVYYAISGKLSFDQTCKIKYIMETTGISTNEAHTYLNDSQWNLDIPPIDNIVLKYGPNSLEKLLEQILGGQKQLTFCIQKHKIV